MLGRILVVDDHAGARRALAAELRDAGFAVTEASDGEEAWARFREARPDGVVTDLVMPRSDGLDLLSRIREGSDVPVILFTARGSVATAAAAFKAGADDFVASPDVGIEDLVALITNAVAGARGPDLARSLESRLAGRGSAMARVRERIAGLAPLWTPVLVSGEPGSGRDAVAEALHALGAPGSGELVRIDTRALSPPCRTSESRVVYLDGVEHLPVPAQSYFADLLATGECHGFRGRPRLLASTSDRALRGARERGFHRGLAAFFLRFQIGLPALRDHPEDVPEIADALVQRIGRTVGRPAVRLSPAARRFLATRRWPGNVRQLARVLEAAVAFTRGRRVRLEVVREALSDLEPSLTSLREEHRVREREALLSALAECGGNVTRAAERLGKSRGAVYRLIERYGVPLSRGDARGGTCRTA